jgi:hypothetical protein
MEDFISNEVHILPTENMPEFIFRPDGTIIIRGRGLIGNNPEILEQIFIWIDTYIQNPAETTYVTLAFEYLNSLSTNVLVTILKKLLQVIVMSKKIVIQWYYEDDDADILERGEYISESFNIPIEFIMIY